jgi:uncharacterized protein YqjF (DUF2071 family)
MTLDRLAPRNRPFGKVVMHQNWENFLFLNWPMDPAKIRPFIPEGLEVDTFEGQAWISITPFKVTGVKVLSFPEAAPFDELNVRTYVHHKGEPGIWFFSLDASRLLPVIGARIFFGLPYHDAEIEFSKTDKEFEFRSRRTSSPDADFRAWWKTGRMLRAPDVDTLPFFLVERYCSFAAAGGRLSVTRIHHSPWVLREAEVLAYRSGVISSIGLPEPSVKPIAYATQQFDVEFWPPLPLDGGERPR